MRAPGRSSGCLLFGLLAVKLLSAENIGLAGTWSFQLDSGHTGHRESWFARKIQGETIFLPGDTDQAGFGTKVTVAERGWLTRPYKYVGPAWYQKQVVIPETWRGNHITLFLERVHWQTEAWVDGKPYGMQDSLSVAHEYDLSEALTPGPHTITICVDNTFKIDVGGRATSVAEDTQTSWNGIVGAVELRATPPVWLDSIAVYTDTQARRLRITGLLHNRTGLPVESDIRASIPGLSQAVTATHITQVGAERQVEFSLATPEAKLWDEYTPSLYKLQITTASRRGPQAYTDHQEITVGLRQIGTRGTQFILNRRPVFLRGTLECNIFPLTGYPAMDVESWARIFRIARSYGLNAFRFHSYCPPEAAFIAADKAGFLLHVELPVWSKAVGKDPQLDDYMRAEGYRILKTYGNHPSFTMMCLGNELVGDDKFMDALVAEFKKSDNRRLYTFAADYRRRVHGPTSDYFVTQQTTAGRLRIQGTRFGKTEGGTDHDFSPSVAAVPMPLVAHELGQWATYPSYDEIAEYTGVLKAKNLETYRQQLEDRGEIDQARDFQAASGKFSWSVYKEEIESALRTQNMGGFFLLQLQDYPGQGEALIGLLDSFWSSKGIFSPPEFRRFCSETVPLLRMKKFVWTNNETFEATAEIAHYGKQSIANAAAAWSVTDDRGQTVTSGTFQPQTIAMGRVSPLGSIRFPLATISTAQHLKITVTIPGTATRNNWDVWVYPQAKPETKTDSVIVAREWNESTRKALEAGRTVLFLLSPEVKNDHLQRTRFLPIFWSNGYFNNQPGTMGILCNPDHPALRNFPTSFHTDWQWWQLRENAHAFILDDAPAGFRPIVQEIDDFHRNHRLGSVIEARTGKGRLLLTSFDLQHLDQRPVARQLLESLLAYAASPQFQPPMELSTDYIETLVTTASPK